MQNTDKLYVESLHRYRLFRVEENMTNTCRTFSNRNRKLQTSKAPLKSQAQGTSLFMSAASNQRGFQRIVRGRLRSVFQRVRECVKYALHRLQLIQNSLARAVTRTPRHHHITPVLKSLHWLKIPERIHFKFLSLTYNSLQSSQPTYLRELFTIQPTRSTRSSSCLTLSRPPVTSHLMFSKRAISITAPCLWNDQPPELRTISSPPPPSLPITGHHLHLPPLSVTPKGLPLKIKISSLQSLLP